VRTEPQAFAAFIDKLRADLASIPGGVLPPLPLLCRVWALSADPEAVYVEGCCTTTREPLTTRWEIAWSDGIHLVQVVGVNETTERWQLHEQEHMPTSERFKQDATAAVTAVRRHLRDVIAVETAGDARDWLPTTDGPSRPTWTMVFRDGGRVTIPLQPDASAETVASARKLALSEL
jgi:hypothetical protein